MSGKEKSQRGWVPIYVSIPEDMYRRIKKICDAHTIRVTTYVRLALLKALREGNTIDLSLSKEFEEREVGGE